ncbi:DUF4266 domain-containing protein [Agaribacter marinus]|uniref:DUF4266 domain-containing protein n=1 Tax=Agaribacter marinus TaxID=1431249 RepID=A0AA37WKV6_9ALTE|nr:DUF4266 domain-containing protein [Agaribacter marinus]GLR71330.1 hypothetical protein GCM10007852_22380 [Agaribacter marinus]
MIPGRHKLGLVLISLLGLSACSSTSNTSIESSTENSERTGSFFDIGPWVKPYERSNLADPIMAIGRNPIALSYAKHVHESREGARGADGSAGGGCGCN